jgi:hypothetical protein
MQITALLGKWITLLVNKTATSSLPDAEADNQD